MNRLKTELYLILCLVLLLTGCKQFPDDEFYTISIPPEKTHQIETLELKESKAEEDTLLDVNEAPTAELKLTLEECRAMTLENNLDLKVQLINPAIAAQQVSEQEAQFEAAFSTDVSFQKTDTPNASTINLSGSKADSTRTDIGVQMPLRTGGTLTFDLVGTRRETNSNFSIFNPEFSDNFSLSISQPLLRNAGTRANTNAIRIAEYNRQITDARTKLEVIRVIADADRVYWRLYAARKDLEVRKQQYDLAVALLEQARRFVQAGDKAQIEITRSEAGAAERLEAIIVAENDVRERQRELKRVLNKAGLQMQTPTIVIPETEPDLVHYDIEQQNLVQIAVENRMEMLELELQIAQDISNLDYMRNQALPLVNTSYTYNINGLGATRDQSWNLLNSKRFEDHRFGMEILIPLGNEAAKSRLMQAFYTRRQRLASRDSQKDMIELEVLNAIDSLEANWQRILASRQSSILSGRLFEAEKRQFELGLRTATDVLQAQADFADAQRAEIAALADYQIALVDIAQATGTLLGAAKVRWEPIVPDESEK